MSTTVTFAENLAEKPELLHIHDDKPFVCRVILTDRTRNIEGEWVGGAPTAPNVRVYGTPAINLYDSAGRGDRVIVHGPMKTETWTARENQQKRTKQVVEVSNCFGEVAGSFEFAAARIERQRPPTSSIMTSTDGQSAAAEPAAG